MITIDLLRHRLQLPTTTKLLGDFELDGDFPATAPLTPAAVLVPIVERRAGLQVVLTRRTEQLRKHAGQISLPGGRIDPLDDGAVAAALREAQEEIGLQTDLVEVLGTLGYDIRPVVGLVDAAFVPTPEPGEVAEVFEAPLTLLAGLSNYQRRDAEWNGRRRYYYEIHHGSYRIWGATAGMLRNLASVLSEAA
jgi:8-oxo-dGTP pyrophosphatase MutT (NUDIX family)